MSDSDASLLCDIDGNWQGEIPQCEEIEQGKISQSYFLLTQVHAAIVRKMVLLLLIYPYYYHINTSVTINI